MKRRPDLSGDRWEQDQETHPPEGRISMHRLREAGKDGNPSRDLPDDYSEAGS